jgi:hypothetical protein
MLHHRLGHHPRMSRTRLEASSDAFVAPSVSLGLCVLVAAMWLIPDPRIERRIAD